MRTARVCLLAPALAALAACASDPSPRRRPPPGYAATVASAPSAVAASGPWDVNRRVAEADATLGDLETRNGFPSPDDRTRYAAAIRRARDARRRIEQSSLPSEEDVAAYEAAIADAYQLRQLYRVGDDARTPPR